LGETRTSPADIGAYKSTIFTEDWFYNCEA
jgi:hypothetical protein